MAKIFTPTNQIRLTNVAVVRMKKSGKRFEIACYRNKVMSWRNQVEKDLDEVLQTHTVFTNVSKGQVAKKEDLVKAFGKDDATQVCLEILARGELQVSDRERSCQLECLYRDIASTVSCMCVNPDTRRPYPVSMIEKAMRDVHYSVKANRGAKQQALEVIPRLRAVLPIERARMRLRLVCPATCGARLRDRLAACGVAGPPGWNEDTLTGQLSAVFLMDPGMYRQLEDAVRADTRGRAVLEILDCQQVDDGEEVLD